MPDVGVHLVADELELVQIPHRHAGVRDRDAPDLSKRVGLEKAQLRGSVAENESLSIARQPPALARIAQGSKLSEAGQVVDERDVRLPRQLHELVVPVR